MVIEFFKSCWLWYVEHTTGVGMTIDVAQIASIVFMIINFIRSIKSTRANTEMSKTLNDSMEQQNRASMALADIDESFQSLKLENEMLRKDLNAVQSEFLIATTEMKNKLDAIIDVQSIVYTTIRDDSVRQTVSNILNNARYKSEGVKESLQSQIDELQKSFKEEIDSMSTKMNSAVERVSNTLNDVKRAESIMTNNQNDNVRY